MARDVLRQRTFFILLSVGKMMGNTTRGRKGQSY